jgi:multiple sugar transport system permease protein
MNNKSSFAGAAVYYLVLGLFSLFMLVPFLWMLSTSLKDPAKIFLFPPQWIPHPAEWSNYVKLFQTQPLFLRQYGNSVYISITVTVGTCVFSSLAGYAFAKIRFPLRNVLFLVLLSGMMIPAEVTVIPNFIWMSKANLANTYFPLIVPPMLGIEGIFGVFLFRQFFITIPHELDEAAEMDGCSPWTTYWRIMIPMSGPCFATLSIFAFLNTWEDFLSPLIFLSSDRMFTLPVALKLFTDTAGTNWQMLMAASVVATVPLLIVFFLAQRRFIEGVALTGLK